MNCERLTRFVYAHDVWVCPEFPSPGTILQTLKKHASSLKVLWLNFVWIDEQANELPPPYIDSFEEFTCLGALWISCACFGEDSQSSVLRRIPPSLYILHLAGDASVVADDLEWWANILTGKSLGGEDTSSGGGSVSSDDESEPVYPQEEDESDFCDQAQDGLEMEEDSLELVEDDTSEGDVDEDVETGDEETDDNSDDEEDEYDIDKYSMEEYKGDDYNEYYCDEHEFEEDGYGQDKNDLEKDEEEILCEGDDVTEDEYECRVGEYGEHEYNEDECEDKREDEPDEDEQQANQQEENHRDDKQDESPNDNLDENHIQKDEGNEEIESEDEESESEDDEESETEDDEYEDRYLGINIPRELAYDRTETFEVPVAVSEVFQNSDYVDFRDWVDAAPGLWYIF
ncbi:hypothetical protein COL922a_011696 [Colletotrichum nupharicola]|nr:hypothetical protein COL922a_011696 [Colletotrichum nupharicola]